MTQSSRAGICACAGGALLILVTLQPAVSSSKSSSCCPCCRELLPPTLHTHCFLPKPPMTINILGFGGLGYGGHSLGKQTANCPSCPTPTAICINSCAWSIGSISNLDSHSVLFLPESNLLNPSLIFLCHVFVCRYPCEPVSGHIYHVCCAVVLRAGPVKVGTRSSLHLRKQRVSESQVDW